MKIGMDLIGIDEAVDEISAEIQKIENLAAAGLWEAGLKIIALAQDRTPVDTGNLRASAYVRANNKTKTEKKPSGDDDQIPTERLGDIEIELGFYAHYALAVHEMVEQKLKGQPRSHFGKTKSGEEFGGGTGKGNYWDSGEPKFLERVILENVRNIIDIVKRRSGGE